MAASLKLRQDIRNAFSPTGATELLGLIDAGVLLGSVSIQLRTDIWTRFSPGPAKELIQRLYGVWTGASAPTQPLRNELWGVLTSPTAALEIISSLTTLASSGSSPTTSSSSSGP